MNTIPPPPGILTDEEFATIQAAGGPQAAPPEDRDYFAAQVNQYKAFRISAPRVEDIEARTASRNFLDKLTLDPDNIAAANNIDLIAKAPPDQQAAIRDRLVVDSWLTDRLRSQTVITPDGSTPAPELDPMRRDEYRDALSQELFGDNAPRGSDAALVAKLRERSDERRRHRVLIGGQDGTDDAAKASTAASLARWAARSAYAGESAVQGFAKWKAQARTSANWTPIAEKQALFEAWAHVYGETKAKAAPYQPVVRQTLDNLKALAEAKDVAGMPDQSPQKFDAAIAPLMSLDERTLLDVALPTLRSMAELDTKPGGTGSFWDEMKDQLAKSLMRPFGQGVGAIRQNAMTIGAGQGAALAENPLAAMGVIPFTPEEAKKVGAAVDKAQGENLVRTMLRSAMTSDIDPIKPNAEGPIGKRLEQMAYDVAGTVAYMTMLSVPYAGAAVATASFADDNTAMLLNKHPDMKASDARAIAAVAAPIQTGIEQLQRLQVMGRVPVFNKLMNRLAGPGGNAAVRFGLYGATGTLVEYTEEKLQDAAPLAVQALASALKQDIPQANLDGFEAFELRTFLAVAPFALIGAGVNVSQDKAAMRQLVSDEAAMRAVGFSEDGIQTIQAAETTEAQTQAIRQAWETRDTTAPADERWQETVRKAGEEAQAAAVKQVADMAQTAGIQQVQRNTDGTVSVTLKDGTVANAPNYTEALAIIESASDAAQGWDQIRPLFEMLDALEARPDAAIGAIEAVFEERSNVADIITRFTDIANDETLPQNARDAAASYLESVMIRSDIYAAEVASQAAAKGRKPDKIDWSKVTIAGQSMMQVREGVATAVIRLDRGASPYTVLEETSEADVSALEQAGMTVDTIAADIRELERRVAEANPKRDENDKRPPDIYLTNYTGTNPKADRLAVVEALSRLVQVYATGTSSAKSRVAGLLREFRKTQRAKLKQAEREGVAPRIMEYLKQKAEWLKLVISQAIRLNRARRAARDAGEEFPLERFLQRVAGVAVETQAAEEVTATAAEVYGDEGLEYIPPEDDELTPFSFQPSEPTAEDARHAALEARAKAGDAEATAEAQAMVDEAAKAAGYKPDPLWHRTWSKFTEFIPGGIGAKTKTWFSNSGTQRTKVGPSGRAIFLSFDKEKTPSFHNQKKTGEYFIKGYARMQNPLIVDDDTREFAIDVFADGFKDFPLIVTEEARSALTNAGHDSVYFYYNGRTTADGKPDEVILLEPNQLKSADPFTYDEAGNLIPLSKRFDATRPEISFSFQPIGIFQMSETGPRAQPTIAPEAQATAKGLADKIDGMYESGQTEGVEDLEAQLEAMLDLMDTGVDDIEANGEETRDIDMFSPGPEQQLVLNWIAWNNPTTAFSARDSFATFAEMARARDGEGPWSILPGVTDEQIEEAAQDAMAAYMRRREALTGQSLDEEVDRLDDNGTEPGTVAPFDIPIITPDTGPDIDWGKVSFSFTPEIDRKAYPILTKALAQRIARISPTAGILHMDRQRVGEYSGVPLQGGMGWAAIKENMDKFVVWAVNSPQTATDLYNRAKKNGGVLALVLMAEGNVTGNRTFVRIWFSQLRERIQAKAITKARALEVLNQNRKAGEAETGHSKKWATIEDAEEAIFNMPQQTRGKVYFGRSSAKGGPRDGQTVYGKLISQTLAKEGFPDAVEIVASIEEPAFKGMAAGSIVGWIRVSPPETVKAETATDAGVTPHISYQYIIRGEPLARAAKVTNIDELRPQLKGLLMSQFKESITAKESLMQSFSFQPSKEAPTRKLTKEEARRKALRPRLTKAILTAMALEQADWRDWYSRHKEVLDEYFGDHADIFQKFLSATSQASSVKGNVTFALKAYGQWLRGEPFDGFLDAVKMNLERVRREEQLSGRKISTYDRANRGSEEVVVDRHIAMLLFKTKTPTAAQFDKAQRILTDIATKIGWKPMQVQAALWAASIVRSGKTPVSYDSYLSTLDSRGAIAGIIGGGVAPVGGGGRYESRGIGSGASGSSNADGQIYFSFQPTAILDDLANKVEARMSRGPQARLETRQTALDNLAALKLSFQRRRDGAGISDERSKASIDAEADVRQAFRAAELMQAAGISYATAREIVEGRRRAYEETLARETHARGVEDKTAQAIRAEAKMRGYFKRGELREVVEIDFSQVWENKDRDIGLFDGPVMKLLSTVRKDKFGRPSRIGNLLSLRNARKLYEGGKVLQSGRWNGSEELPQAFFQGEISPDIAAKNALAAYPELFPPGTTSLDVTPDMLWDAIHAELRQSREWKELERREKDRYAEADAESREYAEQWETEYKAQLEAARMAAEEAASAYVSAATDGNEAAEKATQQAAKEAAAWKRKAITMQNQDWGSKETLVRAMRTLDAILSAFPAAVRGKVGGWLALARIGTQDRMAEEIDRRITILDRELERELRKDALEELDALRERAKPKREAGKRPSGKLGAEAHRFFQRIETVADLTADEVEAAGIALDTLATTATTPEEQADIYERQQILDQFGGLDSRDAAGVPLHDAQALAAALAAAETVYETGRNQWRTQEEARLAEVQAMAIEVTQAVGSAQLSRILAQGDAAKKLSGMLAGGTVSLRSFREVLHLIMGRDNPLAKQWADRAMDAMHARTDELADIRRRWRSAMEAATGQKRHKAEARVWDMGTKRTVAVTVRPGKPVEDVIPIDAIPNLAGLGYNAQEIADAEAAFLALPADSRAKNVTITRWQKDTEEAVSLTDAEAVYYSMLWRQEQYRENLNRAGLGQETQDEIEAGMSDAAKALREFIAGEYAAGYYPLASLFRGMFGVDLPQIANYAPGKWWSRGVEKAMDPSGAGMVEGGFRTGMLKDRKAHLAEPKPENAFALWLGHVSQTAHWKAVAPLARELRGVFGHPEVKKAITARHGAETLDALTRWLDAIEANGVRTNFPAWAQTLLGWQANVKLAWKIGTILKQSTGLIAAAYRMPLKAYAAGMRRLLTGQIDVGDIWNSPMIQRRLESGFAPEVRAAMSRTFTDAPTLRRRFVQKGMELIGYVDAFFATASAAIHYDWQLSQIREAVPGISDAAAKRHAMRETQLVVNATAQPVEITERSLVEMGGFGKVFLIFGSEARQKSSMWITAWSRVLRKQATEEDWRTLAIMHLVVGPMVQLISSAWMDARDDDDDEWFDEKNWKGWDFVRSAALGPMAGIPIIRDLTDGFSGDSGPTAQTAKAMQSAVKIVKGPEDSEDEAVEWYAQRTFEILKGADSFTAVAAGIGEQAFRISDNLMDTREETQAKIDKLARKAKAAKDEDERQELLERIAGLREALK